MSEYDEPLAKLDERIAEEKEAEAAARERAQQDRQNNESQNNYNQSNSDFADKAIDDSERLLNLEKKKLELANTLGQKNIRQMQEISDGVFEFQWVADANKVNALKKEIEDLSKAPDTTSSGSSSGGGYATPSPQSTEDTYRPSSSGKTSSELEKEKLLKKKAAEKKLYDDRIKDLEKFIADGEYKLKKSDEDALKTSISAHLLLQQAEGISYTNRLKNLDSYVEIWQNKIKDSGLTMYDEFKVGGMDVPMNVDIDTTSIKDFVVDVKSVPETLALAEEAQNKINTSIDVGGDGYITQEEKISDVKQGLDVVNTKQEIVNKSQGKINDSLKIENDLVDLTGDKFQRIIDLLNKLTLQLVDFTIEIPVEFPGLDEGLAKINSAVSSLEESMSSNGATIGNMDIPKPKISTKGESIETTESIKTNAVLDSMIGVLNESEEPLLEAIRSLVSIVYDELSVLMQGIISSLSTLTKDTVNNMQMSLQQGVTALDVEGIIETVAAKVNDLITTTSSTLSTAVDTMFKILIDMVAANMAQLESLTGVTVTVTGKEKIDDLEDVKKSASSTPVTASSVRASRVTDIPSYDVGAYNLSKDQLAMVHKGETIIPVSIAPHFRKFVDSMTSGNSTVSTLLKLMDKLGANATGDNKGYEQTGNTNNIDHSGLTIENLTLTLPEVHDPDSLQTFFGKLAKNTKQQTQKPIRLG